MVPAEAYISTPRCDNQIRSKVPASQMVPSCGKQYLMQIPDIAIRSVFKGYAMFLLKVIFNLSNPTTYNGPFSQKARRVQLGSRLSGGV